MKRRDFLATAAGALAAGLLPGCDDHGHSRLPAAPARDGDRLPWRNWSGYQSCLPAGRVAPGSVDEVARLMRRARGPIRPVGAGHSFTGLVPSDGTLLSMRNFDGLLSFDPQRLTATFGAGTKIGAIGAPLHNAGQALQNMPDIDEQSLAGALSTATHGTGQRLGALHSYVTALTLITPRGKVMQCSRTRLPDLFDAARVSLGTLGVIVDVTLQNVPAHSLKRRVWLEPLDQLMERFDELAAKHHSFEMYYVPFCDAGVAIAIDPTDEPSKPRLDDHDNDAVLQMKLLRDLTAWRPGLRRRLMNQSTRDYQPEEAVDVWYRVFPSSRAVRFNEMEYHLPREALMPTLRKVRETLESRHPEIFFPVEVRTVKGDDAWLSPFGGHDVSGSIAVHHYHEEDPLPYFADIEPLYQPLGGRPHWAKMHTLTAKELSARYPHWKHFLEIRREMDPQGRMLNPYLKTLFGLA
ncbi:MAG TPA: D-arabinono-1,4-lactone oxidase [Candidatus Binatia bacterium]|nr:D-arabinono-1,4-lactone oxidase [Candidatus Binatia bacterium]